MGDASPLPSLPADLSLASQQVAAQLPSLLHQPAQLITMASDRCLMVADALAFWATPERRRALHDWACGVPLCWLHLSPSKAMLPIGQRVRRHYIRHQLNRCHQRLSAKFCNSVDREPEWDYRHAAQWLGHVTGQAPTQLLRHLCTHQATAQWLDLWDQHPSILARIEHEQRYLSCQLP